MWERIPRKYEENIITEDKLVVEVKARIITREKLFFTSIPLLIKKMFLQLSLRILFIKRVKC